MIAKSVITLHTRADVESVPPLDRPRSRRAPARPSTPRLSVAFWMLALLCVTTPGWWIFALAPVAAPPEWLVRARDVCFGMLPNGLPDTYGWLLFGAAPLWMLTALGVVWGRELARDLRRLLASRAGRVGFVLLIGLPLVTGVWATRRLARLLDASIPPSTLADGDQPLPAGYPRSTTPVPAFALVDQHGATVTEADLHGQVTFVSFAYAHCQTICPAIAATLERAAREATPIEPRIVLVTLDPWRDTPGSLAGIAEHWRLAPRDRVLSGSVDAVQAFLRGFGMSFQRDETNGDLVHPALVHVVGPDGRIAMSFNGPSARWLADAARIAAFTELR